MIIGLSGYARSGKDTIAEHLVKIYDFKRIAFADPIREFLYEMNPLINKVPLQQMVDEYGWDVAKSNDEVRALLQNTGVGARKLFGSDFWVQQALKNLDATGDYVITDVRFKNEAQALSEMGAFLWRVTRPGVNAINSHISEHDLDDWEFDVSILNDSTIGALHSAVNRSFIYSV